MTPSQHPITWPVLTTMARQMKHRIDSYRYGGTYLDSTAPWPWYHACDEFAQSYLPTDYLLSVGAGGDAEIQAALVQNIIQSEPPFWRCLTADSKRYFAVMAGTAWSERNILNVKRWLMRFLMVEHLQDYGINDTIRGIYYDDNFILFMRIKTVFKASDEGILAVH